MLISLSGQWWAKMGTKQLYDIEQIKRNAENGTKGYKGLQGEAKTLSSDFMKLLQEPVLNLIERKIGKYEIKIDIVPEGEEMTVVSTRNWLMMGYKKQKVIYTNPRPLYKLLRNGKDLLMSDSPQEMFLQYEAYKNAKGRVLVGGLGLGLYAAMIASKPEVTEVIIIEIDKDIIKLSKPKNKKISVVNEDLWKFLKETKEKFDYIYVDIHYSTGCMEYINTVLPMRKIIEKRFPSVDADFWGEEEMKAQYNPDFERQIQAKNGSKTN